ncbi:hypothetical protein Hypma_004402 [Hypsizygus marmoreus]|uniref:Uncharacterized protein n=1 Tax=Hypsizygus marmoreus TaxID=39966 RepID=A0A369JZZ3_HYPMA|nr:hypothetical protein Hypma_004402 [Hypsizygus marmoreus]
MSNTSAPTNHPPTLGDVIDNPFISLKHVNPIEWPLDIFQRVVPRDHQGFPVLPRDKNPPEGFIPDEPIEDSSYEENNIHRLIAEFDEDPTNTGFFRTKIPDLLHRVTIWLQSAKGISLQAGGINSAIALLIGRQQWELVTVSGRHILGKDIYRYTNAISRFTWREAHYLPPGVRQVERFDYPPQDDATLDPLDLAVLIAMAQWQKRLGVRANEFTAHLMYPNSTLKELFVLTATIPSQTLEAIEKEDAKMPPMRVQLGRVSLFVDVQKPLQYNPLAKVLAALIDHIVEIAGTVVREPESASATECG